MSPPCLTGLAYGFLEGSARLRVHFHGDTLEAARFDDLANHAIRLRFRHVDGCDECLLGEMEVQTR
jgi:hypothetical protein